LFKNGQRGSLLVYFNWLHSGWQKCFHIRDFDHRDTVFLEDCRRILQNINSNMERTYQGMNLHRISLRRQVFVEGNISGDFIAQKVGFPYNLFECLAQKLRVLRRSERLSRFKPQRASVCKKYERLSRRKPQRAPIWKKVRTLIRWLQTVEILYATVRTLRLQV
jgi:hypothetical protein